MARRISCSVSLLIALAMVGCAPGNPGLVVLNVVEPNDQCEYATGNTARFAGTLDTSVTASYNASLRVGNQLINLGESGTNGLPVADPNVIFVQEAEVELRDVAGTALDVGGLPNPFTVPAGSGAIPSGDGMSFGEGLAFIELVPAVYTAALAGADGQIVVAVRAVGRTLGDAEVVSSEYLYSLTLCTGCLFGCPTDMDDAPVCRASCTPGQDTFQSNCAGVTDCIAGGT